MSFTKDGVIQTLGQMQALGIFHSLSGQNGGKGGDTPNTGSNSQGRGGGGGGGVDIYLTKNIANISSTYVDGKIGKLACKLRIVEGNVRTPNHLHYLHCN